MSTQTTPLRLGPGLLRLTAPNPSPMTFHGTNSYVLGDSDLAVIDPGPADPRHLAALLALIDGRRVSAILVTHAHRDHSALARPLAAATGAPVLAFGPAEAGRSPRMAALAAAGTVAGGEGVDRDFRPDRTVADGEEIGGRGWTLRALHTPGHMGNHLSFRCGAALFTGDLVMGWASTLISPPDGDLGDFRRSLARLAAEAAGVLHPGHGDPVADPAERIAALLAHRQAREEQLVAALARGPATPTALAAEIYRDTPADLLPAATRNVLAHLLDLAERGLATADTPAADTATWSPTPAAFFHPAPLDAGRGGC